MIKCCKNCEHRTIEPNCHDNGRCKEYEKEYQAYKEMKEHLKRDINFDLIKLSNQNCNGGGYR